jgi:hypothetical protein
LFSWIRQTPGLAAGGHVPTSAGLRIFFWSFLRGEDPDLEPRRRIRGRITPPEDPGFRLS